MEKRKKVVTIIIFFLSFLLSLRIVYDFDLWMHLAVGRFIWMTRIIPTQDIFSFSQPTYPYVYHSWLTEVILYFLYTHFGLWGISIFYSSLLALGITILLSTYKKTTFLSLFFSLLFIVPLVSFIVYQRTQAISFVGLSLVLILFQLYKITYSKWILFIFSILFMLWVNLHGGFLLGLAFLATLIAIETGKTFLHLRNIRNYILLFICSLAGTLINPYGVRTHLEAIWLLIHQVSAIKNPDWAPLFTRGLSSSLLFGICISILCCIVVFRTLKTRPKQAIITLIFYIFSLFSRRFILPLIVLLIPEITLTVDDMFKKIFAIKRIRSYSLVPVYVALSTLALIVIGHTVQSVYRMHSEYTSQQVYAARFLPYALPYGATQYMKRNGVSPRLLNDANWGGYLEWNFPNKRFFFDGRMDTFYSNGESFANVYMRLISAESGWESILDNYQIDTVLASTNKLWPLIVLLKKDPHWTIVYNDNVSIILQR